jgi:hypothetical protein
VKGALEKSVAVEESKLDFEGNPRWQLMQRIIASPQFARSTRLKSFLQYVMKCTLLEHSEQVTEQQIGVHVFGKPADYNAAEDNIVRSQARFLRGKLAEYFASEAGREESLILTIPKGSYLPCFTPRTATVFAALESPAVALASQTARPRRFLPMRTYWVAAAIVALLCMVALLARPRPWQPSGPVEAAIWPRVFDSHRPTTIVAADYIFSMAQEAAGHAMTLDEYLGADYFDRIAKLNQASGLERLFPNIAQRHYTGFENVTVVARLMSLKPAQSTRTEVRFARDMTMRDLEAGNVILLGSKQSNPWDSLFEPKLNYRFEFRNESHSVYIMNRAPRPGEEAEYLPSALDAPSREVYGGIVFLPNVNRESNILILQGTSMAGLEIALQVLDNPALFRDLVRRLGAGGRRDGELPYFEALIGARTLNGVAGESTIVACRVIAE